MDSAELPGPKDQSETATTVAKRAVILVHGWGHHPRNSRRDILVDNLAMSRRMPVGETTDGAIAGETFRRLTPIQEHLGKRPVVDVFEAYWADLIPATSDDTPPQRFWSATKLLFYWMLHPWWLRSLRQNRSLTVVFMASGLLLLLWYATIIVALAGFVVGSPAGTPSVAEQVDLPLVNEPTDDAGFTDVFNLVSQRLQPIFADIAPVANNEIFLLLLIILSIFGIGTTASVADFVRRYLSASVDKDLDAVIAHRLQTTLQRVFDQPREDDPERPDYDEVVVLGHSMGGVIGLEVLATYDVSAIKDRTTLITWGAPLAVLAHRSPKRVHRSIMKACSGRVPRWFDVYSSADWLSARLPAHDEHYENSSLAADFSISWLKFMSQHAHDQYYYHPESLSMLLAPQIAIPAPPKPTPPGGASAAQDAPRTGIGSP